jgi:hypothetical protein
MWAIVSVLAVIHPLAGSPRFATESECRNAMHRLVTAETEGRYQLECKRVDRPSVSLWH